MSPKAEAEQTAGCTAETPHPEAPVTAKLKPRADRPEQPAAPSSAPEKAPVSAQPQQPDTPEEEPPGKLSPGESVTAVLTNYGEKEYAPGKGRCFLWSSPTAVANGNTGEKAWKNWSKPPERRPRHADIAGPGEITFITGQTGMGAQYLDHETGL